MAARGALSCHKFPPWLLLSRPKAVNLEFWSEMQFKREKELIEVLGILDDHHDCNGFRENGTAAIVEVPGTSPNQPILVCGSNSWLTS